MGIGDIWRCGVSGQTVSFDEAPPKFTVRWANVWWMEVTAGITTPTGEGTAACNVVRDYLSGSASNGLFGAGVGLKSVTAVRQSDGFEVVVEFEESLANPGVSSLPPQVCICVTGRTETLGRRSIRYAASISEEHLGDAGQLLQNPVVVAMVDWFRSGTFNGITLRPVLFDEDGVLPTEKITRAKVSDGFRTQRRRSLTAENETETFYEEVN